MIRVLTFLVLAAPAAAQEFTVDAHIIDRCRAIQEDPMVCVGREADRCTQEHGGGADMMLAACTFAEAEAWDDSLNAAYRELQRLAREREDWDVGYESGALLIGLRDMQRAWITYRDAVCANAVALAKPFGSAAGVAEAECLLEETAQQFIKLNQMRWDYTQ
ncbi:lysozyme inhibitor LprI family protein [Yoonia litorea]|uniref:Uncharacterized conserved protein YecT, DUF1311 family n=1 Tax=Yoonia litorea TaxID=1123755 RepID=A0A1I6LSV4_9RHOB|nr:lysozyme inhibitor LprI family protein [Yoonia litorea]SFS06509.1 Uncharacterized conserved protein YecT, DUF1311 family [Yoonia litorea]